ncbi:Mediator of RNA polymerase II transcription subunit 15a [Acorus calamus]|uniref:Mediator of RNA polymerase II transcription subunit 15a n=1 Tax=Acorus calamus TaxID=4465 RepID=A0AAV9D1F8_ACOCL|nr:Mediator of RNA polymerase II transcription subunit 15a [Acorus calamus]
MIEIRKIAVRFEEKTYASATSQTDYLRRISLKMLSMDTKNPGGANPCHPMLVAGVKIPQILVAGWLRSDAFHKPLYIRDVNPKDWLKMSLQRQSSCTFHKLVS